jgi:predicted metal-binding protein
MDIVKLEALALCSGAARAKAIDISKVKFYPEFLEMCRMNSCGAYGANWTCPPACPSPWDMERTLGKFCGGILFQYEGVLKDRLDYEAMDAAGKAFQDIALGLAEKLASAGEDFLVLGAGGCRRCAKCTYPNADCRHPVRLIYPMEGCGINVSEVCEQAALPYIGGKDTVIFTGLAAV